jgi:hypothetical protein
MVAEVFRSYDAVGRPVWKPDRRTFGKFGPNAPLGRHVTQPLNIRCENLEDVRRFLSTCRYVSDQEQFGRQDYWIPPEEFEQRRRGDCEDFALWTWRQLLNLGYAARFVGGRSGRYGEGHAWVTFERDSRTFIVESQAAPFGLTFPRLSTLRYEPAVSASWDGRALKYYEHARGDAQPSLFEVVPGVPEYIGFHARACSIALARRIKRARARHSVQHNGDGR